jgi:hypothetical protein
MDRFEADGPDKAASIGPFGGRFAAEKGRGIEDGVLSDQIDEGNPVKKHQTTPFLA